MLKLVSAKKKTTCAFLIWTFHPFSWVTATRQFSILVAAILSFVIGLLFSWHPFFQILKSKYFSNIFQFWGEITLFIQPYFLCYFDTSKIISLYSKIFLQYKFVDVDLCNIVLQIISSECIKASCSICVLSLFLL